MIPCKRRVWFGSILLCVLNLPSGQGVTCSASFKLSGSLAVEEVPWRMSVRNVFQCHSACHMDGNCRSVRYDYRERVCQLTTTQNNKFDFEIKKFEDDFSNLCKKEEGPCGSVCSSCPHKADTLICLKMAAIEAELRSFWKRKPFSQVSRSIFVQEQSPVYDKKPSPLKAAGCGPPKTILNGNVIFNTTTPGSVAYVVCSPGYNYTDTQSTFSCTSYIAWETVTGSCEAVNCGLPDNFNHGRIVYNSTTYASIGHIVCDIGYNFTGQDNTISCGSDGKWDNVNGSCTVVDCGIPDSISNGEFNYNKTFYNSIAEIACHPGYNFTGDNSTIICSSDGKWRDFSGSCRAIDCGPPKDFSNGYITFNTTTFGSVGHISCNAGYNISDINSTTTCGSDGNWESATGSCTAVDCGPPESPLNGYFVYNATNFGSERRVYCNTGYNYSRTEVTTACESDGQWEKVTGLCTAIDCGLPPDVANGNITYTSTTFYSLGYIVCNNRYAFTGSNNSVVCTADGDWQPAPGDCVLDCGPPPPISNGRIIVTTTTVGSSYQVACDTGYSFPNAANTSQCTSAGEWQPITGSCDVVYIGDWILLFRATADIGQSLYGKWMDDTAYNDYPVNPQIVPPGCMTLMTSLPCNIHFKSKLITTWDTANIKLVRYLLLKNDVIRSEIIFNGTGASNTAWFHKNRVINSTWTDLKTSTFNYFSIEGHPNTRRFFINEDYHGCPSDHSWTVIIDGNDQSHPCGWDNPSTYPKFIYTKLIGKTLTGNLEDFEYGDGMAVLVKLDA